MRHPSHDFSFLSELSDAGYVAEAPDSDLSWRMNNSSFDHYARLASFPGGYGSLKDIILNEIVSEDNVGMDLAGGSQGTALRDLLDEGILDKGLVTNLHDRRTEETKQDTRLDHIAGDLAQQGTWQQIADWQQQHAPEGLSLIMHRPFGSLQDLPPPVYAKAAHVLIDMLRPGGMFFTQVPKTLHRQPRELRAVYRDIRTNPDVREIIPSARARFEDGKFIFGVILKAKAK